ncbi:MAG: hypothetical protein LCH89_07900 [Proteobacteria bacterium]|nr:hypothetical protein [Pseudomonadota bacterium]
MAQALQKAGALSGKQRVFGLGDRSAEVVYSTIATKPAQGMPVQRAQEIADRVTRDLGVGSIAGLHVVREPAEAGFRVPATVVPQGATRDGQAYIFGDGLHDDTDAFKVVVHELFHLGLSKSVEQEAYTRTMLSFLTDPLVRQYAQRWKASGDGQARKGSMPVNNWQALAVEEALADIAEQMHAEGGGAGTKFQSWAARMLSRFANLAQRMGLPGVAEKLRAMTRTEAERFIQDMLMRSGSADPVRLRDTRFSSSPSTKATYESRIDALFAGEKAKTGTKVLDRSDVMGLLGYPDVPLILNESHLRDGMTSHPEMTAKAWKRVPEWIDNPAAAYTDPRNPGRLTLVAPQTLAGYPVIMAIEPNPGSQQRGKGGEVPAESLLVTVYAKTTGGLPAAGLLNSAGRLKYVDTKNAPEIWQSAGGQFPRQSALSQGRHKILTEKHLAGWRCANDPAFSRGGDGTPIYVRNKEALEQARASAEAAPGLIPLHRDSNSPARVLTRADVVKSLGARRRADSPAFFRAENDGTEMLISLKGGKNNVSFTFRTVCGTMASALKGAGASHTISEAVATPTDERGFVMPKFRVHASCVCLHDFGRGSAHPQGRRHGFGRVTTPTPTRGASHAQGGFFCSRRSRNHATQFSTCANRYSINSRSIYFRHSSGQPRQPGRLPCAELATRNHGSHEPGRQPTYPTGLAARAGRGNQRFAVGLHLRSGGRPDDGDGGCAVLPHRNEDNRDGAAT